MPLDFGSLRAFGEPAEVRYHLRMDSLQVLVADDEPVSRTVVGAMLKKAGFVVQYAPDGEQAWARLDSPNPPALALPGQRLFPLHPPALKSAKTDSLAPGQLFSPWTLRPPFTAWKKGHADCNPPKATRAKWEL